MPAARTVGDDPNACGGDADRLLELRRKRFVAGDRGPAIRKHLHMRLTEIDHGFDGEDHAGLENITFSLGPVMQNVGLVMEHQTHPMTAKIAHYTTALAFGKHLN